MQLYSSKKVKIPDFLKKLTGAQILVGSLVFVGVIAVYSNLKYRKSREELLSFMRDPASIAAEETARAIERVGELTELPTGETPTVATVNDLSQLEGQTFFENAQIGDKVLIYQKARRAILYRPGTHKVIEIGPVNLGDQGNVAGGEVAGEETENVIKVAIYNGTSTADLEYVVGENMEKGITDLKFDVDFKNSTIEKYAQTLVIDISGEKSGEIERIASVVGGSVADFPEIEKKPDADILIIAGADWIQE